MMKSKLFAQSIVLVLVVGLTAHVATTAAARRAICQPIKTTFDPSSVVQGNSAQCTVDVDVAPSADQSINMSYSAGAFVSPPGSVTVLAGHTSVTFTLTTNSTGNGGTATATASANGGEASGNLLVDPNPN